ncbi:Uncharacterized protein Adt_20470 [Abeliophyllum distichum]|uniref:Uncharacterized protein n=1 Tax=Abeliophyllum distichum TaxID=126358 RepID=A0ABD1SWM9_9LAMI
MLRTFPIFQQGKKKKPTKINAKWLTAKHLTADDKKKIVKIGQIHDLSVTVYMPTGAEFCFVTLGDLFEILADQDNNKHKHPTFTTCFLNFVCSVDCGIHVCHVMERLAKNEEIEETMTMKEVRQYKANMVSQFIKDFVVE